MSLSENGKLAAIIMAAGQGKRMKNPDKAKVLHEVGGEPMLGRAVRLADESGASPVVVIIGHQREAVKDYLQSAGFKVETAVQDPQLGTGHAVMQAEPALKNFKGAALVLSGDVPLLKKETINNLLSRHLNDNASVTVLTAEFEDPSGYGRIVRRADGAVEKIVEHKDADDVEKQINEINSGIYLFDAQDLFNTLKKIKPDNAQAEYYLTDVFELFYKDGRRISAVMAKEKREIQGANTIEELEDLNKLYAELAS